MDEMVAVSIGARRGEIPADKARRVHEWLDAIDRAKMPHPFRVGTFHCFCATCGEQRQHPLHEGQRSE